jgi:hypothetical protein
LPIAFNADDDPVELIIGASLDAKKAAIESGRTRETNRKERVADIEGRLPMHR